MKNFILFISVNIVLFTLAVLISSNVNAVYFTPNFIQKADMTEGMRQNICPVNLRQELLDTIGTKNFADNIDAIFNETVNSECAGDSKVLTLADVEFTLRKDSKKVSDRLFILDEKIFNVGNMAIISSEDPNNPEDDIGIIEYAYTNKIYNFDPSLTSGPYEKIENSLLIKNQKAEVPSFDDLTAIPEDFPTYQGSVSSKICDQAISNPENQCIPNVVKVEVPVSVDSLIDWYSNAENLNGWTCAVVDNQINATYEFPIDAAATCFKGDSAVYSVFSWINIDTINNTTQVLTSSKIDNKSILMFEGQMYKFLGVDSLLNNINLLDYSNLTDEELNKDKVTLPSSFEGFPIYPNNEYINKVIVPDNKCASYDFTIALDCGGDTYTLLSSDDIDTVLNWYKTNVASDWKCNFDQQLSPEQAAARVGYADDPSASEALLKAGYSYFVLCSSPDETKEYDARSFSLQIKAIGSVISEIMVFIPKGVDIGESSSVISAEVADFPLYVGSVLDESDDNKKAAYDLQFSDVHDSISLDYTVQYDSNSIKYYDLTDKILEYYKTNPLGWSCTSDGVDYVETGYDILCQKDGKQIGVHSSGTTDGVYLTLYVIKDINTEVDRSGYIQIPTLAIPTDLKQYPNSTEISSNNIPCNPDINDFGDKSCYVATQYSSTDTLAQIELWYASPNGILPWTCTKDEIWSQSYQDSIIFSCISKNPSLIRGTFSVFLKQNQSSIDIEHKFEFWPGDVIEYLKLNN
ncbi:hypothetical protein KBB41_01645 [Candidatus Curtissbacteria bacterium]|nr:hypothetical protein [Candidatus Curtissbacteria bacterium]